MILQTETKRNYTPEEYLEAEVQSDERHEYIDGEILLMTGGLPNHNKIAGSFYSALRFGLKRKPYEPYVTDQRLWIPEKRIYTYPDVMVMAQPIRYQEGRRDTLIDPILIAEVLSKSTCSYDKGDKFDAYKGISTFQEYLLIDQYTIHVEHYVCGEDRTWISVDYEDENAEISLSSVSCQILVSDLYDKVDFSELQDEESDRA
ncbi:MAG: Uma2 family endonuclease [Plectolyngbya sp. WJT66-NPBG17]|jgi:Uma2 family endonuclease|nr:Uma2 family endonuclease [Plectolyngbya sp. WJT66-NPBG17]MBW4523697.1 Uma2 family endonuclease [Phormidium tanganyikae FI6-MK23]